MNLVKTLGIVFIINIAEYLIAPVGTIIITKSISVSEYGFYSFILTLYALITNFSNLGFSQYNYKHIPGRPEDEQYLILGRTTIVEVLVSLVAVLVLIFFMKKDLLRYSILIIFCFRIIFSVFNNEIIRFIGFQKRNALKAIIGFFDTKFWILLLVAFFYLNTVTVKTVFISQLLGNIVTFSLLLIFIKPLRFFKNFKYKHDFILNVLKYSLPLIMVDLGVYLLEMGSRYILKILTNYESIGYYSFAYSWYAIIGRFGMLFIYILQPYFSESFYKSKGKQNEELEKYKTYLNIGFKYSLILLCSAIIVFMVNYKGIILLIGKSEYLVVHNALFALSLLPVFMFLSYFTQIIMILNGDTKSLPGIYLIVSLTTLGLNFILISYFDYLGAALSSVLSYIILFIILYFRSRNRYILYKLVRNEIIKLVVFIILYLTFNIIFCNLIGNILFRLPVLAAGFVILIFGLGIVTVKDKSFLQNNES